MMPNDAIEKHGQMCKNKIHATRFYKDQCKKKTGMVLKIVENIPRFWSLFHRTEITVGPYFFPKISWYLYEKLFLCQKCYKI